MRTPCVSFSTTSSQLWTPRRFDEAGIRDTAGRFLLTFKNVYTGIFAEYANFGWSPSDKDPAPEDRPLLDRWVLSRLATVEREADELLARYEATNAAKAVMTFFDEDVSKWYVRQSRHRFYDVDGDDNRAAFATLHEIIAVTCRLLAPFAPFITDWVHRELDRRLGPPRAVHPRRIRRRGNRCRSGAFDVAHPDPRHPGPRGPGGRGGEGASAPRSARLCRARPGAVAKDAQARAEGMLKELSPLLAAELNIKKVEFISSADDLVTLKARPNFRSLGKKFGKDTPLAAEAVQALSSEALREFEAGKPLFVSVGNESRELSRGRSDDRADALRASLVVKEEGGYFAALEAVVTHELRLEGLGARSGQSRSEAEEGIGFRRQRSHHALRGGGAEIQEAVKAFQKWIADEVLALKVSVGEKIDGTHATHTFDLDGQSVEVALERVG